MDFLSKLFKTPNKNGNICERGQGPALEALKSPNEEPTQLFPEQLASGDSATVSPNPDKEEDQSQRLSDTNSASFVSLSTLSALSESALNTAVSEQSRPKSADTDSLDYESADEAASLKTGQATPADETEPSQLNETLGLDALTNKLSSLYLNSPNPPKKLPAFHTEDSLSSSYVQQPRLDETESDISFNASLVQVIEHSVELDQSTLKDTTQDTSVLEQEVAAQVIVEEQIAPVEEEKKLDESTEIVGSAAVQEEPQAPQQEIKAESEAASAQVASLADLAELATREPLSSIPQQSPPFGAIHKEEEPLQVSLEKEQEETKAVEVLSESPVPATEQTEVVVPQTAEEVSVSKEIAETVVSSDIVSDLEVAPISSEFINSESTPEVVSSEENQEDCVDVPIGESELKVKEPEQISPPEVVVPEQLNSAPTQSVEFGEKNTEKIVLSSDVSILDNTPEVPLISGDTNQEAIVLQQPIEDKKEDCVSVPVEESEPEQTSLSEAAVSEQLESAPTLEAPEEKQSSPVKEKEDKVQNISIPLAVVPEKPIAEVAPISAEPLAEVSFEEPLPLEQEPEKSIEAILEENIPIKQQLVLPRDIDSEPEKEVSVEKPFEERKVSSAPLFVQHRRGGFTPHKDPLISSTGSLSELLDLCQKQQRTLDDEEEIDTKVVEETNELEDLLAAEANFVCEQLNASFGGIHEAMSDNLAPVTPPRRSRSPRKPSPARNFEQEKSSHSPARKMEGTGSSMTNSGDSAVSSRINMGKSTDSNTSPKSLQSMDSGICGAEVNQSEAGPEIASENFVPASEELFKDPSAFDFLSKFGGNDTSASRLERESLYVKFDPLVGNRDRRVFLSPCIEASPRSEDNVESTPLAESKQQPKSETPLTSRHATGPLIQIATPINEETPVKKPEPKSKAEDLEGQAMQEMIVLLKKESEELKKLLHSQNNDYENKLSTLQSKMKQKTEAEEQMSLVMKEYEDTISRILAEKEKAMEKAAEDKRKLSEELSIVQSDLSAAEVAFSDLHRKYERAKAAIEVFRSNENTLKQSNVQFQEQIKQAEKKYVILKTHAEDKLEEAARENEALVKQTELEVSALKAQSAQLKARNTTLVETLAMRERENQELMTICDDLVQKLGTQSH